LWYWSDANSDANIDATELAAVADLQGVDQADLTADNFEDFAIAAA